MLYSDRNETMRGTGVMRAKFVVMGLVVFGLLSTVACLATSPKVARGQEPAASSRVLGEKVGLPPQAEDPASRPATPAAAPPQAPPASPADYPPMGLELEDMDGVAVSLRSLRGRWVLLDFFTTYSIPSQTAMPVLNRVWQKYRERGVSVVGVSLDMQGHVMVEPFLETLGVAYPVYLARGETLTGRTPYGFIQEIPATLLIAPDGTLDKSYRGGASQKELERDLDRRLK